MENEKRLEDALSDVKAELSELKMALTKSQTGTTRIGI